MEIKFPENKMSGYLFADDFVGLAESRPALQNLIDIVSVCEIRSKTQVATGGP